MQAATISHHRAGPAPGGYAIVRIQVRDIVAKTPVAAARRADQKLAGEVLHQMFQRSDPEMDYADAIDSHVVDPLDAQGRVQCERSITLDNHHLPLRHGAQFHRKPKSHIPRQFIEAISLWKCPEAGCGYTAELSFADLADIGVPICGEHGCDMELRGEKRLPVAADEFKNDEFLTAKQKRAYFNTGCGRCSHCGSKKIKGTGTPGTHNSDADWHANEIRCHACGAAWNDIYILTDIQGTEAPTGKDSPKPTT